MSREQEPEGYILQGMARAIWGHAFVQWATNVDPPPEIPANSTWADVTPPTPAGALKAAKEFARGIGELNHLGPTPLTQMFSATRRYVQPRHSATMATEADQAFQFGEDVALACLGTLEVPELGQYKIPEMKAMLDDDGRSLSWDEGWTWHPRIGEGPQANPSVGDTLWAVLVYGQRHWEPGGTSEDALRAARVRHGQQARLETGPNGDPIRSGECAAPPAPKRPRATTATRAIPVAVVPMSIEKFAQAVNETLPAIVTGRGPGGRPLGRFGPQKVFTAAIWRRLQTDPRFADMARQATGDRTRVPLLFKQRLTEANRKRLLSLARADLVGAMDPDEVMDSEIHDLGATFHFVIDPAGR